MLFKVNAQTDININQITLIWRGGYIGYKVQLSDTSEHDISGDQYDFLKRLMGYKETPDKPWKHPELTMKDHEEEPINRTLPPGTRKHP